MVDDWLDDVIFIKATHSPAEDAAQQEVHRYLRSDPKDLHLPLLKWWEANQVFYPNISRIAKTHLAVPASSVPSERVFSLAGSLVNKKEHECHHQMLTS